MLAWSPILVQKIEIHALGFVLRKLQLNRHREAEVASHRHAYAQLILYLAGEGMQRVAGRRYAARSGDLFIIPPHTPHGVSVIGHSRPLCLVLDFETEKSRPRIAHRHLPQSSLNELHALLTRVPTKGRPRLGDYAAILAVVAHLLEPARAAAAARRPATTVERVRELLRAPTTFAALARETGYHRDHLSRKLKRETGLGLRGLRDQLRLETAQHALRAAPTIAEASTQAGFDDPNYFARWFRHQTGHTPSAWLLCQP
jgi:AraC-like DNA-binding protein